MFVKPVIYTVSSVLPTRTDGRTAIFAAVATAAGARRTGPRPRRRRPQKLKNKSPPDGRPSKKNWLRTAGRTKKNTKKSKCVSNDRSHHDDQNEYRIIKNGAILKG